MTDEKDDDLVACSICGTPSMEAVCSSKCEDDYGDDLLKKYPGFLEIFNFYETESSAATLKDLIDTLLAAQNRYFQNRLDAYLRRLIWTDLDIEYLMKYLNQPRHESSQLKNR